MIPPVQLIFCFLPLGFSDEEVDMLFERYLQTHSDIFDK